jgi:predicted trehalose synthase
MTIEANTISKATIFSSSNNWEEIIADKDFVSVFLLDVLEEYIQTQSWFGGKSSQIKYIKLTEYFKIQQDEEVYFGLILKVNFVEAFYHHYFLPIVFVADESVSKKNRIVPIKIKNKIGYIIDAIHLEDFRKVVYERISFALPVDKTPVQYHKTEGYELPELKTSKGIGVEQSNTSIIYNDAFILKFFRRIYADKNPDYEMSRFLSHRKEFKHTPLYLGSINIIDSDNTNLTIDLMQDDDFCILDFEGEPESTIRDRKVQQPPLNNVAGLFRSFHYAIYSTIFNYQDEYKKTQEELFQFGELLYKYMVSIFMKTYVETTKNANLHIGYRNERIFLLKYCLPEKAIYELGYELNSIPKWTIIPLKGIANTLNS